jgi:hypothetical protein
MQGNIVWERRTNRFGKELSCLPLHPTVTTDQSKRSPGREIPNQFIFVNLCIFGVDKGISRGVGILRLRDSGHMMV